MSSNRAWSITHWTALLCATWIIACSAPAGRSPPPERSAKAAQGLSSFVQNSGCEGDGCSRVSTLTFPGAQAAGHFNVVFVSWADATQTVTSVTDGAGNAYSLAVTGSAPAFWSQSIYYAKNISAAASNAVTVQFSGNTPKFVRALEYSGVHPTSPFDVALSAVGEGTTASSGPLTTTANNDLIVVGNVVSGCVVAPTAGFADRIDTGCDLVEDQVAPAAGSVTVSVSQDDGGTWLQQMAAFKAAPSQLPAIAQATGVSGSEPGSLYNLSPAGAQTAGDLNLLIVGWPDADATVSSVTDTTGNTYIAALSPTATPGFWSQQIYYAKNIAGAAANRVNVTFSAPTDAPQLRLLEYADLDPQNPLDAVAAAGGESITATSGPVTTTQANDLLVVANLVQSCDVGPGSGFTARDTTGCDLVEDAIVSAPGSYSASVAQDGSGPWVQQMVALKQATAGTGPCQGVAEGASCNDGNPCTTGDACHSGTCGGTPVTCTALDPCHAAGTCDPSTGQCSNPPVTLPPPSNACALVTCNPSTGIVETQCSSIDRTVATTVAQANSFLYTGSNPLQTGVTAGTISATRAAVIRGRVLDPASHPLVSVSVGVVGRPEFGSTLTLSDGTFSMAVNGGSALTLAYSHGGFLPVHRTVDRVPWNGYATAPDVVLTPLDAAATGVDLSGSTTTFQVARAVTVGDSAGTRTATLLIAPGTLAQITAGGATNPVNHLTVRATEYTVGSAGPQAMPGTLPPTSAYTYAFALSADEALAVDGRVDFNQPVLFYTDNFLHFGVGQHVPVGFYDRTKAGWAPVPDGRVIKILGVSGGVATLDIDGSGTAASAAALTALGVTTAEQTTLATVYSAGTSLWRVPVTHFSDYDPNWPFGPPCQPTDPNCVNPNPVAGTSPDPPGCGFSGSDPSDNNNVSSPNASIIECQNGILHESIPLVGTPYRLVYSSDRVAGYGVRNHLDVPISGSAVRSDLQRIDLEVIVAGRTFAQSFPPNPNQTATFDWDGNDAFGRAVQGAQVARVGVGYVYNGTYFTPGERPGGPQYDGLFGHFSWFGTPATGDRVRQEVTLWTRSQVTIGHFSAEPLGLGGWMLDAQEAYDPAIGQLVLGDGTRQDADVFGQVITTVAGTGAVGAGGDGGPATTAMLNQPWNVALAPDGSLFVVDRNNFRIRKIDANGIITTVAGSGVPGFAGDGGPATQAQLRNPEAVAIAPDGTFYIADVANQRVRKVDSHGIISTIAGTGVSAYGGDGGPATAARLANPNGLLLAPDGSLYIADSVNSAIRKIDPAGIISTIAGTGAPGFNGDGQNAIGAQLFNPHSIVLDRDGNLLIADRVNHRIRRVGVDGKIQTFAGTGATGFSGDGGPAVQALIGEPHNLAYAPDGTLYFSDHDNARIRAVSPAGIIRTVAGNGTFAFAGDGGAALNASFNPGQFIWGLAVSPDGQFLYAGDGNNNRVRRLSLAQPGFSNATFAIASRDGTAVYGFDPLGRHLSTRTLPTGVTTASLAYDSSGRLQTLTDASGNVTTIQRDGTGKPTAIIGPFGSTTALTIGTDGYLAGLSGPAGKQYAMTYQRGLLSTIQFPTGSATAQSTKQYDALGHITSSTDAAGHTLTFQRTQDSSSAVRVSKTTGSGVVSTYLVTIDGNGVTTRTMTLPDGTVQTEVIGADGKRTITSPDGTQTVDAPGPDSRFGMQSPVTATGSTVLPNGQQLTRSSSRSVILSNPRDPLSVVSETDTTTINGKTWTTAFDATQRTFTMKTPLGRTTTTTVDAAGRATQRNPPSVAPISMTYDPQGRLKTTTQGTFLQGGTPVARTVTLAYDALGFLNSTTDPLGVAKSMTNDAAGRATATLLPDGRGGTRSLLASYDGDDNVISFTLPGGAVHGFSYDPVGAISSYSPPSVGIGNFATQYQYDADGRIQLETRPDGSSITYEYDAAGRLRTTTYPQGVITRAYDATTGQLTSITAPSGANLALGYVGFLPRSATWSGAVSGSVLLGYDNTFRTSSISLGGTLFSFGYDDDNLITQAGTMSIARDPQNGRVTTTALGSVTDAYTYDANGLVASYVVRFSGVVIYSETIGSRDGNGRILQRTEIAGTTTHNWGYTYDTAGRLTDVTEDSGSVGHYEYDVDDNRVTSTGPSGTIHPAYDAQDRLLTYGSASYAYGTNGELQSKTVGGQTTTYQYDVFGNLLHVGRPGAVALDYLTDGENQRVAKVVGSIVASGYLYQDVLHLIAQLDAGGNAVAKFVFGTRPNVPDTMVTSSATYRLISDHTGSVRMVVNASTGVVAQQIDYDAWGLVTGDTSPGMQPFGFAGGLYDKDTGLTRFGARDYDASVGRWTSKDPIRFLGEQNNLYVYVGDDPVDGFDPTGEKADPACKKKCMDQYSASLRSCGIGTSDALSAYLAACLLVTEGNIVFCVTTGGQAAGMTALTCAASAAVSAGICVASCPRCK